MLLLVHRTLCCFCVWFLCGFCVVFVWFLCGFCVVFVLFFVFVWFLCCFFDFSRFNCITLEGDQKNKKGALTGGFFDKRFAKLPASKIAREWREKGEDLKDEAKKIKTQLDGKEQIMTCVAQGKWEGRKREKFSFSCGAQKNTCNSCI